MTETFENRQVPMDLTETTADPLGLISVSMVFLMVIYNRVGTVES